MNSGGERRNALSFGLTLFLAILVGVLLRAEYLRELLPTPFGRHLVLDAQWYDQAARTLLAGKDLAAGDLLFRPPLYPVLLAGVYKALGPGLLAPRLLQSLLGLATVVLVARIARRTHGEAAAKVAAILAATYGMFIYFEAEILTATLGTFFVAAATALFLEGAERGSRARMAASGLAIGLAAICHGTLLAFAPVAAAALLSRGRSALLLAAVLVLGVAAPLGVVAARNLAKSGELVVLGSQGGVNFYIGNNPTSDGKSALAPGFAEAQQVLHHDGLYRDTVEVASRAIAERERGRRLSAAQVSSYWYERGIDWIRTKPREALVLDLRKLVYFWNGGEISNNRDLHDQAARQTPILRIFLAQYSVLLPLAIYGAVRQGLGTPHRRFLAASAVTLGAATALFFVCSRFRQPALVWILPFAAAGLLALVHDIRDASRDRRRAAIRLGMLAALVLATNPHVVTASGIAPVTVEKDAAFHRFNLAVIHEQEGNFDRAIEEYRAAAKGGVADPRIHLNLGNVLTKTGRYDDAREQYLEALRIAPDFESAVRNNLGIVAAHEGNWELASREFEKSVEANPENTGGLTNLTSAYLSIGKFDEAIVTMRRTLLRPDADEPFLRRLLGVAYHESGLLAEAEVELTEALRLEPTDVVALLTMAKICAETGRHEEAERWWTTARQMGGGSPAVEQAIREYQEGRRHRSE
jgi:Flp pilus assembly protein TadD